MGREIIELFIILKVDGMEVLNLNETWRDLTGHALVRNIYKCNRWIQLNDL